MPKTVATKPYDWTYTTNYPGHVGEPFASIPSSLTTNTSTWTSGESTNPAHVIPLAELTRPDPILLYAEIPLFEDELHDNGASSMIVRIVRHFFL
jgi:type 2A phosphatase activator TIP41